MLDALRWFFCHRRARPREGDNAPGDPWPRTMLLNAYTFSRNLFVTG